MTVLNQLASSRNRRDEVPNQELAFEIVRKDDSNSVKELVDNLSNKNRAIQSDCIKVLYEIGERRPSLIARYYREFGALLESNNNRLAWGAMIALDSITHEEPKSVYSLLPKLLAGARTWSVISRDHAVGILAKLGTLEQYAEKCIPLLIDQLSSCPNNQFPMYAERSLPAITTKHYKAFHSTLVSRLKQLEKDSQKKRVIKLINRIEQKFASLK
jgi:hypothetical protein